MVAGIDVSTTELPIKENSVKKFSNVKFVSAKLDPGVVVSTETGGAIGSIFYRSGD